MESKPEKRPPENPNPGKRRTDPETPKLPLRGLLIWVAVFTLILFSVQFYLKDQGTVDKLSYNPDFVNLVESHKVTECEVVQEVSGGQYIMGTRNDVDPVSSANKPRKFRFEVVVTDDLPKWLRDNGVKFQFKRQNPVIYQILSGILPVILILGLLYFLFMRQMRSMGNGAMSFGKSRARMLTRDRKRLTFKDVAGIDEAKDEVVEIVEFLKDPKKFQKLGGRIPKGVLLMGPPGTGKTLLAKTIAGEADVPFFSISGSDFVEMFVGVGASRVRDMFEQGKKNAPCLIFIDEIDAVGRSRFSGVGGGHDEREQTLNALLVEMDGFDTQEGIIIIAATNRPDVLDPALQRPGRFDRQIVIDLPTLAGRVEILKIHSRNITLDSKVDLMRLARGTPGFSGADLANLMNEAALLGARTGKEVVVMSDLEEARDKVRWGRERRSRVLDDKERRITAIHESGHALVMKLVAESEPLHKITIIPRGSAYLGATMQLPEKDRYTQGRVKLQGILAALMGGRAAEELMCGDITTGARSDLREATRLARLMVCEWGMSSAIGPQTFGNGEEVLFLGREMTRSADYSEATSQKIDGETGRILREAHDQAQQILETNRELLDKLATTLMERETLDGVDVDDLLKYGRIRTTEERLVDETETPPVVGA